MKRWVRPAADSIGAVTSRWPNASALFRGRTFLLCAAMNASPSPLRLALAGMLALAVAQGIGRFVYTPILPGMMEGLHLTPADAGWIASANYLGYLIGALAAAGDWAHGRERMLTFAGLAATAVLAGLMGLNETMAAFLVIRFLA